MTVSVTLIFLLNEKMKPGSCLFYFTNTQLLFFSCAVKCFSTNGARKDPRVQFHSWAVNE